jgi:uncharacterized membrane protein
MNQIWIYSIVGQNFIPNKIPVNFSDIFPNQNLIVSVIGTHYLSEKNKYYFFSGIIIRYI